MWFSKIKEAINGAKRHQSTVEVVTVQDDDKPHSVEVLKHSKNYSKLLDVYVDSVQKNVANKNNLKIKFFWIIMVILIIIVASFCWSLIYAHNILKQYENLNDITIQALLSVVTIIFPTISSLIVAFIKIPEIIAHYLFNIEEDNYINAIIKSIQDYDKEMFASEHKIDDTLMAHSKVNKSSFQDEGIMESPAENIDESQPPA